MKNVTHEGIFCSKFFNFLNYVFNSFEYFIQCIFIRLTLFSPLFRNLPNFVSFFFPNQTPLMLPMYSLEWDEIRINTLEEKWQPSPRSYQLILANRLVMRLYDSSPLHVVTWAGLKLSSACVYCHNHCDRCPVLSRRLFPCTYTPTLTLTLFPTSLPWVWGEERL